MNCRGMALLTGLLLMAAVSLLAVTAAGGMTLQRHQAANYEDEARAAARAGLARSHALAWLFSRADIERQAGCIRDCLLPAGILSADDLPDTVAFESEAWWQANASRAGDNPATGEPLSAAGTDKVDAMWLLQEIHFEPTPASATETAVDGVGYYRIVARGKGRHAGTVTVTESIVARPWGGVYEPAPYPPDRPSGAFCDQFDVLLPCGGIAWRALR